MSDVLVVSPERTVVNAAASALAGYPLFITGVPSYRDALYVLARKHVAVILCDDHLPDGSWKDLLGQIALMPEPPRLVVMTAITNRAVSAEAINLGSYDVLATPVDQTEILQVVLRAVPTRDANVVQHT
jgi:DNA-binding NtrC family response regulator